MLTRLPQVVMAVLLVAVAAGAWVWAGDGGDPSRPRVEQVEGDPRRPSTPEPNPPLVRPRGEVLLDATAGFEKVEEAKVLAPEDLTALEPHVDDVTMVVTRNGDVTTGTWLFTLLPRHEPRELWRDVTDLYERSGFETTSENPTVQVLSPPTGTTTYRAHYVSRFGVVRVEAHGPDPGATRVEFDRLLESQLRNTPALS